MTQPLDITKKNAMTYLIQYVEAAQKTGAYTLAEAAVLEKAVQYFTPDVKVKPSFGEEVDDPYHTAKQLLYQAAHKGQAKGAFGLKDASFLFEILKFQDKEDREGKESIKRIKGKGSTSEIHKQEVKEEDEPQDETGNDDEDIDEYVVSEGSHRSPVGVTKVEPPRKSRSFAKYN